MKRLMTSTCLAAAFAVGLAAQTTGTAGTQDPPAGQRGGGRSVTATGCLRAGDTAGTYQLTDVQMQGGGRRGGDTGAASGTGAAAGGRGRGNMPTTVMLNAASDVDLKPHVGHKIEVTGTMTGGGRRGGDTGAGSGTGTGTGTGTGAGASGGQGRGMRSITVTSVRMISESCTGQ
jgi:hypothetical protein